MPLGHTTPMPLRTFILSATMFLVLVLMTSQGAAARYVIHDWTIDTPVGHVGYVEFGYTPVLTQAGGGNGTERLFFVGSRAFETRMSPTSVAICGCTLLVGFIAFVWYFTVSYARRRNQRRAT